jgi:hypothetical protein
VTSKRTVFSQCKEPDKERRQSTESIKNVTADVGGV